MDLPPIPSIFDSKVNIPTQPGIHVVIANIECIVHVYKDYDAILGVIEEVPKTPLFSIVRMNEIIFDDPF